MTPMSKDEYGVGRSQLPSRTHVVRGGAIVVASSIISKLLGLISAIVVARSLTVGGFGTFSFAIAYGSFFALFADLGLDSIATRELASRDVEDEGQVMGSVLAVKAAIVGISLVIAATGLLLYSPQLRVSGLVAALAVLNALPGTLGLVLVARLRMLPVAAIQVGGAFITLGSYLAVAAWHNTPVAFIVAEASTTIVAGIVLGAFAHRSVPHLHVNRRVVGSLLRSIAPLALGGIAILVYRRSDQLLLAALSDVSDVGHYAAAVKVVDSLNVVPEAVAVVALPVLARRVVEQSEARAADAGFRILAAIVLPVAAVGTVAGGPAMALIFGRRYSVAGAALAVLLWAHFFGFVGTLLAQLLVARRQEHALAGLLVAAAIVNVAINVWAIPRYADLGAAWASFAAYTVPFVVGSFVGPARAAVRSCLRSSLRPAIGAGVLMALLGVLQPSLRWAILITVVVWPPLLLVTRSTSWMEVRALLTAAAGDRRPNAPPND